MMIERATLYILIPDWMTLTFIQGHSCMRNENFCAHFFLVFVLVWDAIQHVATTCWLGGDYAKFDSPN